jgi:hypothetical protein
MASTQKYWMVQTLPLFTLPETETCTKTTFLEQTFQNSQKPQQTCECMICNFFLVIICFVLPFWGDFEWF